MIVISDSSPLISLLKVSKLELLRDLYNEVLIPVAVFTELTSNQSYKNEADIIKNSSFIKIVSVKEEKSVDLLQRMTGLDLGESEAIIYADENKADILLMDEVSGRKVAKTLGIHVRGTIGILLLAYDKKLLSANDVDEAMEILKTSKRRISSELI